MTEPRNLADAATDLATIGAWLERGHAALRPHSESAQLDAELLLAHVLEQPRSFLRMHVQQTLATTSIERYRALLARREQGEPVAYLTGEREFWSLSLRVTPAVLVPRPETELAVERCLALHSEAACRVADLGTGSGAIALALASERRHWHLVATDRSEQALRVARANAARLQLGNVEFLQGNWFEPLGERQFDIIVSNPPYVASSDPVLNALRFEPGIALSAGADGLQAMRAIIPGALAHLVSGGWLVLEHGTAQGEDIAHALVAAGYARVRCHADLAGHDRVTEAQRP
jgi:release factor glutamine methyltransferase